MKNVEIVCDICKEHGDTYEVTWLYPNGQTIIEDYCQGCARLLLTHKELLQKYGNAKIEVEE